ncbi:MAG: SGNH/GDSL hydrolase family protein [Clostridia bacterium]|nr:SGNH/GDSL hydrolase family protein [Clostridia bacterium]
MSNAENITFDTDAKTKTAKEDIEWLRLWCEQVNDNALPHIALVGDSITEGYFRLVQKAFEGIARVDYLATSYSIASDAYAAMVKAFIADSDYVAVHYNYGLHAYSVTDEVYAARCKEMLTFLSARTKTVVGLTTTVLTDDLKTESAEWKEKVIARNAELAKIAEELRLPVNDLYTESKRLSGDSRAADGVHFSEKGYAALALQVTESLKKLL